MRERSGASSPARACDGANKHAIVGTTEHHAVPACERREPCQTRRSASHHEGLPGGLDGKPPQITLKRPAARNSFAASRRRRPRSTSVSECRASAPADDESLSSSRALSQKLRLPVPSRCDAEQFRVESKGLGIGQVITELAATAHLPCRSPGAGRTCAPSDDRRCSPEAKTKLLPLPETSLR